MLREYELMVLLDPDLSDEEISKTLEGLQDLIKENGGEIEGVDEWGRRSLAYEIRHKREGYYAVLYFKGGPDMPDRIRHHIQFNKNFMRGMILRRGE